MNFSGIRKTIGVYPQKATRIKLCRAAYSWSSVLDMFDLARIAEVYGTGEIRFTVEQNLIIPNIPDSRLEPFLQEPLLERFLWIQTIYAG